MSTVIKVEGLSKLYRLGEVGTGTLSHDLRRWWYRVRGKEDPYLKLGQVNDRTQGAENGELVWALRDITFEVKEGDVLGIIGRNGAGKSTLLKILSRITSPTEGVVKVKGRIASLLEVGTGFHPELTGRENIYMNGTIMGMRRAEIDRRLDEIVEFAGVAKYLDTPVKRYSSGMTVRLGFAVAAHLNAEILLVDEVLAVGDADFQKKALGKMHEVSHDQGRTVLFVSHNMGAVKNLCQRGIVLNSGQILIDSTVDEAIVVYFSRHISNLDLENYPHREGNGNVLITKWTITDEMLGEGDKVRSNYPAKLNVYYKSKLAPSAEVEIAVIILNQYGEAIGALDSRYFNRKISHIEKNGCFQCNIKKLPLAPGHYRLNILIRAGNELADHIRDAGTFEVVDYDVFGTGKKVSTNKHGYLLFEFDWKKITT
jgi:lipopolysaccharide transport system ATP-binding protein